MRLPAGAGGIWPPPLEKEALPPPPPPDENTGLGGWQTVSVSGWRGVGLGGGQGRRGAAQTLPTVWLHWLAIVSGADRYVARSCGFEWGTVADASACIFLGSPVIV